MNAKWLAVMIAATAGSAQTPSNSPVPSTQATTVQAFVPFMQPLTRVRPVFPQIARDQHLSTTVLLFVTVDPDGKVTDAEAAGGPSVLRQPAIDAVRQYTYRPIQRSGAPVFAMTEESVSFLLPGEKMLPPDRDESIGAAKRANSLRAKFPRDAAMIFADTEDQSLAVLPALQFRSLPKLARTAFEAGDLASATKYATEALAVAYEPRAMNYKGDLIFDGNDILGHIALKNGDPEGAERYLLASATTSGSPTLGSFGPNMSLANELLQADERDSVLDYFNRCRSFWKMGSAKLDDWSETVREGGIPNFGFNLKNR